MKTIWKYELKPTIDLVLPWGYRVLSVHSQGEGIFLWVLLDPKGDQQTTTLKIRCFPTGGAIPYDKNYNFLGTAFLDNGLVFHVFEEI